MLGYRSTVRVRWIVEWTGRDAAGF